MTLVRFHRNNCAPRYGYNYVNSLMPRFWNEMDEQATGERTPDANIFETRESFRIELMVPGFTKEQISIKVENRIMRISGELVSQEDSDAIRMVRKEFERKAFSRSFRLSNMVDHNNITAKYENGVLLVEVPKHEEARVKPSKDIIVE